MVPLGRGRQPGARGTLAAAVRVAFDYEFVAGGGEPVDGGLGQQRVGHEREPLTGVSVGSDHGGGFAVAFGDDLVEVGGLGRGEGLEREIIDDEQLDGGQAAVFVVQGVVQAGGGGVPGFGAHGGVQAGVLGAQRDGAGFASGDLVGQDQLEEVGVGHVVLAGQGEAFGQGGGELAELEGAQGGGEVGADRVGQR